MKASEIIRKGTKVLYFKQPEEPPKIVKATKQKGKGVDVLEGTLENETKKRLFTVEKLEFMDGYDKYKMQAPPMDETEYELVQTDVTKKHENQQFEFVIEHEQTSDGERIYIKENSICVAEVYLVSKIKDHEIKVPITNLMIDTFNQDCLIETLQEEINKFTTGHAYEFI